MKQLVGLLPLFILMACGRAKTEDDKHSIDRSKVDFIEICNHRSRLTDSVQSICKQLNSEQVSIFIKKWNKAKFGGIYKLNPRYVIRVTFKDNKKRSFRINGGYVDEQASGWCFDLGDSTYIEQLWTNAK